MTLEGRRAVITGGGRGIGAASAWELVRAGASVLLAARTGEEIDKVAAELRAAGHQAHAHACDVADAASVEALHRAAIDRLGGTDILVNAAGFASSAPVRSQSLEEWERLFAVNTRGVFLCTQAFLPGMMERGWGRVVNIASIASKVGHPYIAAYTASKHAVLGFTRAAALEVAAKGVTVNAVCPGYVDTAMTDKSVARIAARTGMSAEAAREALRQKSPQNRLIDTEEIAFLVGCLCHPRARGINGQGIVVDGGAVQS